MNKTLSEIAPIVEGRILGNGDVVICGMQGIEEAREGDLTFLAHARYRPYLDTTRASAILVPPDLAFPGKNLLVVADPYRAFGTLLAFFHPEKRSFHGIHPRAVIDSTASVAATATIYPGVVIGPEASIAADTVLFPGVFIDQGVVIDAQSCLHANVSVYRRCRIGKRVVLHAGVVVGSDGFGFACPGRENAKIPQTGIVQIDDDCEIGANTTIDRATMGRTWIQRGVKIDNLVQIGHNVVIGEGSVIVAQVGIAGSTKVGKGVLLGGQAGVIGHLRIGDHAMIAAQSGVHKNVAPGAIVSGSPDMPHREWLRVIACLAKLPAMRTTLNALVKRLGDLEKQHKENRTSITGKPS